MSTATRTQGVVRSVRDTGRYKIVAFEAPALAEHSQPGQFVSLAQDAPGHILRRPFSVLDARDGLVEVGFDVVGDGTRWLASLRSGETLDAIGPLGVPYTPPSTGTTLLVGGGYGAAPLMFFASRFAQASTHLILGAATASRLFDPDRGERVAGEVTFTTEDGSRGFKGRVTDAMKDISAAAIYACGPMAMLAAVVRASPPGCRVEVAVEEFMGCGIGVCWTCVIPTAEDGYRKHVRSCIDGPVFDGRSIVWA